MAVAHVNKDTASDPFLNGFRPLVIRTLEICELLESLADELPKRPIAVWREAKRQSQQVIKDHASMGLERTALLLGQSPQDDGQRDVLLRFEREYGTLTFLGEELDGLFVDAVSDERNCICAEALGFALRGHFDALRKHVEWETEVLFPMAERIASGKKMSKASERRSKT